MFLSHFQNRYICHLRFMWINKKPCFLTSAVRKMQSTDGYWFGVPIKEVPSPHMDSARMTGSMN